MMLQLNPPLPMETPRGAGFAHFLIDYGPESDLYWTVIQTDSGEIWTWSNREVRACRNMTLGRTNPARPGEPPRPAPEAADGAAARGMDPVALMRGLSPAVGRGEG